MGQFLGWILGMAISSMLIAIGAVGAAAGGLLGTIALIGAVLFYLLFYTLFYFMAWSVIGVPGLVGTAPTRISNPSEHTLRSIMIGMNVVPNLWVAIAVFTPISQPIALIITAWLFVVISLAAFFPSSQNRIVQGFVGWTGWITPISLPLTTLGFLLFLVNLPFTVVSAIASGSGQTPIRLDFTSGVVESAGWGPASWFNGGTAYSVGHFTFVGPSATTFGTPPATAGRGVFLPPLTANGTVSGHEVGHSLDWVAFGPLRWVMAIVDQLIMGNSGTAYTELSADSRTPRATRFQVDMWS